MKFLPPCQPKLRPEPPRGPEWQHEVKFDGYRVQLHKPAMIYSKNGSDFSKRFKPIMEAIALLPTITCVIDGELIVPDDAGSSDFKALHLRMSESYLVWCFDLLEVDGVDLRDMPLRERREKLEALLVGSELLRYSEAFDDPGSLLKSCAEHGLEGIVSKRKDMPYRPDHCDWVKVKCPQWKVRNQDRGKMFEKP
jgi:ATP-dependent DNA ligase